MHPREPRPALCMETSERLPWLFNGTLLGEERRTVLAHLRECASCRCVLDEVRLEAVLMGLHPEPDEITGWVRGSLDREQAEVVAKHLAACSACSEEVAFARQGLARVRTAAYPSGLRWWAAAVAGIAAGTIASWLLAGWPMDGAGPRERLHEAEARIRELTSRAILREAELAAARGPQANVAAVDVFPVSLHRRSSAGRPVPVVLPPGSGAVLVVLNSQIPPQQGPFSVRLLNSRGDQVWATDGVVRQSQGEFTVLFPPEFPAAGEFEMILVERGSGKRLESYRIRR